MTSGEDLNQMSLEGRDGDRSRSPRNRKMFTGSQPGQATSCCSRTLQCETETDLNWLNMGPARDATPCFWSSIDTSIFINWEKAAMGNYGMCVPICKACVKSMRTRILNFNNAHGAEAIAINMLAEQIYFEAQQIVSQ